MIRAALSFTLLTFASCWAWTAIAQSIQPTRPIKINTVVTQDDLIVSEANIDGAITSVEQAVGLETRKTLYPGRPVMAGDLGPVTVVDRNQLVELVFLNGALKIKAEGRSLGRASIGQRVRVMNSDSRLIVTGIVTSPSIVEVSN